MKTKDTLIEKLFGAGPFLLVTLGLTRNSVALTRILITALATLAVASSQAAPKGGGGGGAPTGTIYFVGPWPNATSGGTAVMTTMNPDGSNKTVLGLGLFGVPSKALHGGHRWFVATLGIADQYYPDGVRRREVFAFRDDYDVNTNNTAETRVLLTDDTTLEPWGADWVPGDNLISFIGRRWSSAEPDATVEEGGLYTASLLFGTDGSIIGLATQPAAPTIPMPLIEESPGEVRPDVTFYSWDPTASMITYTKLDPYGVWVADLLGGDIQISAEPGHMPVFSPDGTKIAFTLGGTFGGIFTMKPNGKSVLCIVRSTSTWFFNHAVWSPDSRYLVFIGQSRTENNMDLFRATSSGGNLVQLTITPAPFLEQMFEFQGGWR